MDHGFKRMGLIRKSYDGGAEAAGLGWRVGPVEDEVGACEDGAYGFTLDTNSFAVNNPHYLESLFVGQAQVFPDDGFDIARSKRVEIDDVVDLDLERLWK